MKLRLCPDLEIPPDAVSRTFGVLAVRGAGKSNTAAVMAEEMFTARLPFVVVDPVGSWYGLRSNSDGTGPGLPIPIFGGKHGDIQIDRNAGELLADLIVEKRLSCVLDLSRFGSEADKKYFLLKFAQRLYEKNEDPLHLFLEEADDYIPQKPMRDETHLLRAWENIVRRGRARGLGMTLITQRSAAINKMVLTQVETLFAMRTTGPQDIAAIEAWVKYHNVKGELLASLSSLPDGDAWVWSPQYLGIMKRVHIRRRQTFDSGATPKNLNATQTRKPATLADVDLQAINAQMAAVDQRAKADDPALLKKEIVSLKKEIVALKQQKPEVITTPSPPLLTDEDRSLLNGISTLLTVFRSDQASMARVLEDVSALCARVAKQQGASAPPQVRKAPATIAPAKSVTPLLRRAAVPANNDLTAPERRILTALAQRPAGLEVDSLAMLAGYTVNGHFNNQLGTLRTRELVTAARITPIQITDAGLGELGDFEPLPTGEELQQYWLRKLSAPEARILGVLLTHYPEPIDIEELAAESGYTINGHFNNQVGQLRTKGLMSAARMPILASAEFFE